MINIQQFYNVAQRRDFARLFQFQIERFANIDFKENHLAYIETATLPGRTVTNIPVTYQGMDFNTPGTVKYPGSANYKVTFRCDSQYDIRSALEAASFDLFDEGTGRGSYGMPGLDNVLIMQLFDKSGMAKRYYTLYGVWVQGLDDTQYDVKDGGTIQTIGCTLAYQFWRPGRNVRSQQSSDPIPDLPEVVGANSVLSPGSQTKRKLIIPTSFEGSAF